MRPSHDIFSIGVVAYEALVQSPVMKRCDVQRCAQHGAPYPWEEKPMQSSWCKSSLRKDILEPCLARDPANRPKAEDLVSCLDQLGVTTMASGNLTIAREVRDDVTVSCSAAKSSPGAGKAGVCGLRCGTKSTP